jgi:hypothetical protein
MCCALSDTCLKNFVLNIAQGNAAQVAYIKNNSCSKKKYCITGLRDDTILGSFAIKKE